MKTARLVALAAIVLAFSATGPMAIERVAAFYQFTPDTLEVLGDPKTGLPNDKDHLYIFTASTPSGVNANTAKWIHSHGSSFKYGPCFDVGKYTKKEHILSADEATCAKVAREFRDRAIEAGADYFGYNEAFSDTSRNAETRKRIAWILKYLHEPDAKGRHLDGVFYLVEKNCYPERWQDPDPAFWKTVNETCRLVVAEHYHGHGFLNENSEAYMREHYISWYNWFKNSADPNLRQIAKEKYCILHSTRFGPGDSGWAGANSDKETLDSFAVDLAKDFWLSRALGNPNNICFGPMNNAFTNKAVYQQVLTLLKRHYCQGGSKKELEPAAPLKFAEKGANAVGFR